MPDYFKRETLFLLTIFILGQVMGFFPNFYQILLEYDFAMHFIGGALVSSIVASFLVQYLKRFYFVVNVAITVGVEGIWEVLEFLLDIAFGTTFQPSLVDTMGDIIIVFAAAIVVNSIYYLKNRSSNKE